MKNSSTTAFLVVAIYSVLSLAMHADTVGPQAGQKVAFLGDSITEQGANSPGGYVRLVESGLEKQGRKIEVIPAGVSGNNCRDMLARLDKDVLSKKPDWMTLSCGVNDVWQPTKAVPLDEYQKTITSIVDQATAAGIKVIILTATMIGEDPAYPNNQKLAPYNDFLRSLAAQRHFPLADLNADMQAAVADLKAQAPNVKGGYFLTVDGVHMNGLGNETMAAGVLKAMGLTDAQLAPLRETWMGLPNTTEVTFNVKLPLTVRDYLRLRKVADSKGGSLDDLGTEALKQNLSDYLKVPEVSAETSTNSVPMKPGKP